MNMGAVQSAPKDGAVGGYNTQTVGGHNTQTVGGYNTQNVNYGFTPTEGDNPPQEYGLNPTAPPSYNNATAAAAPPMGDVKNQVDLPYAPPPYPGFYVPLPVNAPPPFEAAVSGMYPSAPPGGPPPVYTPPLQPQPIAGQPTIVQQPVVTGKGGQFRCVTCCKVTCSVIGHLGMMACLVTIIVHLTMLSSVTDPALIFGLSCGMLALAYIIMLCEVRCSDTHKYVSNFLKEGTLHQHISNLCNTRPSICWSLECYHYETRYRTVSSTDSNGHTTYRTESYQERVVTYRDSLVYSFSQWRDVSPPPPPVARGVATRLAMYKTFTFADESSMLNYASQKDNFYRMNRHRDTHMDFHEDFNIDGFKERLTAYVDEQSRRTWMSAGYYWLISAFCCTWPYRYYFRRVTNKDHYTFIKEFGL